MATQLNNFTASSVTFNETAGVNVSILHPSATIVLTPDPGYTLTSTNFSPILPLPNYISGITFQQSGENVNVIATFTNPFTMPQSNVSIPLCINGQAILKMYSISGSITKNICNISGSLPSTYSGSGNFNTTSTVLTIPVNAVDGYYFPTQPMLTVTNGVSNSYTITSTNSFDGDGNLIGTQFNVNYTFPNSNITSNVLTLNACAYEIYVPTIEVTNYSINTGLIIAGGETRIMQVFGNEGAVFTVAMNGTNLVTNVTIDSTGIYSFPITFPAVTSNTTYTITLSGDLADPFLPQNPFTIQQKVNTQVTLNVLFNSGIASVTPVVKSFTAFGSPVPGEDAFVINFPWDITPSPALIGDQVLVLSAQPTEANWSNLNSLTNGGTILYPSANVALQNPAVSGTITVTGNIETYGGANMTTTLDLTSLLTIQEPLPYSYTLYYLEADGDPNYTGFATSNLACDATTPTVTVYSDSSSITAGAALYYDEYGTTPINCPSYNGGGSNTYFKLNSIAIRFQDNTELYGGNVIYDTSSCISSFLYLGTANTYTTSGQACAQSVGASYYLPIPTIYVGQVVYTDPGLTSVFNGNDKWIKVLENGTSNINAIQVNSSGQITAYTSC